MGAVSAKAMAEMDTVNLRTALSWHLTSNHYPPVPTTMISACIEALDNANEGSWEKLVGLPEGVKYQGLTTAPTHAIINQHHLESFLDDDEY